MAKSWNDEAKELIESDRNDVKRIRREMMKGAGWREELKHDRVSKKLKE